MYRCSRRAGLIVISLWLIQIAIAAPPSPSPNIIILLADQWRAQAFGFAGDPNARTPNFDRLAAQSVQFTHAVSGVPVCSPTRASLLTGQRPLTHGVFLNDVPLRTNAVTLPKVLRAAGYDTAMIGKWHVDGHGRSAYIPPERRQGFDYWKVRECTHDYTNSMYYADGPERLRWPGYDATAQMADAQNYLQAHAAAGRPFFLMLAWGPPHDPYFSAPERYRAMFDPARIVLRPNVPPEAAAEARRTLAGYYAHAAALDDSLGQLLQTLEAKGLAQNTILLFSSDHGDMLFSQGQVKKQKPYEESIRVPMLVRWPARLGSSGRSVTAPLNSEDVMPTLLGLIGRPIPASVEGLDFSGYLRGGPDPSGGAAIIRCIAPFGEWDRRRGGREYRGIVTERYTYVRDLDGPWLLFDLRDDPFQTNNLAHRAAHTDIQRRLDDQLREKLAAQGDHFRPAPEYITAWGYRVDEHGTVSYSP